jgi:site-specific DNA-methyltransferase (adenine-specific)
MIVSGVYNEDCIQGMKRYPDKYFDLALVDPPYGIGITKTSNVGFGEQYDTRNGKKIKIKARRNIWDKKEWDNYPPTFEYFNELKRVSKNQIIWGVNYFNYFFGSGRIVWDKVCNDNINDSAEEAYCSLHNGLKMFRFLWNGIMQGKSILEGNVQQGNKSLYEKRIHPTQKPIALYSWIYHNYLPNGGKVIDTHLGSGSNRIAADKAGNIDFYGFEIDKEYFDAQEKRFKEYKSQLRLF